MYRIDTSRSLSLSVTAVRKSVSIKTPVNAQPVKFNSTQLLDSPVEKKQSLPQSTTSKLQFTDSDLEQSFLKFYYGDKW
jgi:hypothetical protein